jgi:hypothetical protein
MIRKLVILTSKANIPFFCTACSKRRSAKRRYPNTKNTNQTKKSVHPWYPGNEARRAVWITTRGRLKMKMPLLRSHKAASQAMKRCPVSRFRKMKRGRASREKRNRKARNQR